MLNPLSVLQHLPTPQFKEVIGIGVELPSVPSIVSELVELLQWRGSVAARVRREHGRRHRCAREQLLLERSGRTEGFPHLDILE